MSSALSDVGGSELVTESSSSLLEDLRVQGQQLAWLKDKFKLLVVEGIKTQELVQRVEENVKDMQSNLTLGMAESLDEVKRGLHEVKRDMDVERQSRSDSTVIAATLDDLKEQIQDVKFSTSFVTTGFSWDPPASNKVTEQLSKIEKSIETIAKLRAHDVASINSFLTKLDERLNQVARACCCNPESGSGGEHSRNFQATMTKLAEDFGKLQNFTIPDIEEAVAQKVRSVWDELDRVRANLKLFREESENRADRTSLRDANIERIILSAENAKAMYERNESGLMELKTRSINVEQELRDTRDEISRLNSRLFEANEVEERIELIRAEMRVASERGARMITQEVAELKYRIDQISSVKDDYLRLTEEVKLTQLDVKTQSEKLEFRRIESNVIALPPPPATVAEPPVEVPPVAVTGPGELEVSRDGLFVAWKFKDVRQRLLKPNEYPRMVMSSFFPLKLGAVKARLKLFVTGSDQCRKTGFCSLYLRCPAGVRLRFCLTVNGEPMDTFECSYDQEKDKGKHELCKLEDYLKSDGSVVFGVEVLELSLVN